MKEDSGTLRARPYARLLSMIGDQLIKNEKIALIELVKNSYDADANWVQIRFEEFQERGNELVETKNSRIEIEDDGEGMSFDTLKDSWMNPATPVKYLAKERGKRVTTSKHRTIQGEKGIGRFAVHKLGKRVDIVTRAIKGDRQEIILKSDFSAFDDELITEGSRRNKPRFLDEVEYAYEIRERPLDFAERQVVINGLTHNRLTHGTLIRIHDIRGIWTSEKIDDIQTDVSKMGFPFGEQGKRRDFQVEIILNGRPITPPSDTRNELERLFSRAPIRVTDGTYNAYSHRATFDLNESKIVLTLDRLKENKEFRKYFCEEKTNKLLRKPNCGSFKFRFYVFDLSSNVPGRYTLDSGEKDFVKSHRIYLYRDEVRVYPYGDPTDDWLGIDTLRGIGRAGDYLSNDQTIGYISITGYGNPQLKDKTSREGLLELGNAFTDFQVLIQGLLGYIHTQFKKYRIASKAKRTISDVREHGVELSITALISHLEDARDVKGEGIARELLKTYKAERQYLIERAETSEDLASVGLTVEAASHDLMLVINKIRRLVARMLKLTEEANFDRKTIRESLVTLESQIEFIGHNIEGIQPLFRSSQRAIQSLNIRTVVGQVRRYYDEMLNQQGIAFVVNQTGDDLRVKTNEAVLLQAFMNLLDNSVYWLGLTDRKDKRIEVAINSKRRDVVFSDNGPGVSDDDLSFIFEPFFSTKGISGRGLGLYIARQLMERNGFEIDYSKKKRLLDGANFILRFNPLH